MDRRVAIKNMSLTLGYAVATPTILSVLQSCTSDAATWAPTFFTKTEGHMITQLSDIILPATDIAGALDVNVPEFMDKMFDEILDDKEKTIMKEGAISFANEFKNIFDKEAIKGTKDEYEKMLDTYFNVSNEQQQKIVEMLEKDTSDFDNSTLNTFLIYLFLTKTRYYTLFGFYTSEHVGKTILSYDPIPGVYKPCIPLEEVGNSWSL